ncbi:hypothetical protein [Umezakia ovalisporum]|jgi:hypothetical protein|uniref:Uncharacterized protein n=2 Tax=Umezakia ovalisporum TaxID=75695 RepID=A0AA43KG15_9CYAN|nr:hypothetical protein [Umezakia ovalisporum]MBI1240407.1 hypothetical protein [Nostoc sp. RI_552]MDH6055987.1 hypothetical protein [Umezakia ovalisporum FSS-43]MDH6065534.1 hypothetical protein [Umezakia ovalisporum FSS-62]MDH6066119.1 hypothetical protein [Umezakia ovalisporum APH033B]MDH6072619.1 hypothetical protein [Umezakia ovalisporum CobakiLakeA]
MHQLRQLLEIENSELAKILKFSLYGLEATLHKARTAFPLDPGTEICDELLQEISTLLQPPPDSTPEDTIAVISSPQELKLIHLRSAFNTDAELSVYLGNSSLQSQTDAELWNEIHRKLLRVPENLATAWRKRALDLAQEIGAVADNLYVDKLPFSRDEIIYPGLNGVVKAQGLCLSEKALLNTGINPTDEYGNLYYFAGVVHLFLRFIEIDPDLHHALKSVFSFDIMPLQSQPEQRTQYINTLSDRWRRLQDAESNSDELLSLRAWIDMDEAIHSLVFIPPVERYSWWGNLQQESRRILKKMTQKAINMGSNVRIRQLSGIYADVCPFSQDDLQLNSGGVPGEVLTCLRVYARINQEEIPGRVIFRSLR